MLCGQESEQLSRSLQRRRFSVTLFSTFGAVAEAWIDKVAKPKNEVRARGNCE